MTFLRRSGEGDLPAMLAIINDAAQAYRGVIPGDRWHEPYMSEEELASEIAAGVIFWVAEQALVRHAYVAPTTAASWAIDFYRRNGFTVVSGDEKDRLLRTYWSIPERQIETSVVLAR